MKTPVLSLLLAAASLLTSCDNLNKPKTLNEPSEATADTAVVYRNDFDLRNVQLTEVKLPEVKTPGTTVRGDANYQVYSLDETVLFDLDKAAIRPGAAKALDEILASINQRYTGKDIRVMGFTDSTASASYNMDLAKQRAEAVKSYLTKSGKIPADKVTTESFGQRQPVATNATPEGRQKNRRVEIVVRTK
ncbi:hypothetical protein GCM10023185_17170 [Hymenobacter saemangeumensis]|uniref:OmpA-like domain-containing protein n=1 Tax=Hymenobacter saemangeumensis TaxID=1084522 RepID=A0ABP8IAN8_9BACT